MKPDLDRNYRYTIGAILFHWLSAVLIIFMLALGLFMKRGAIDLFWKFELYQLHKSIGITLFLVTLLRLVWRLSNDVPYYKIELPNWVKTSAALVHWALYLLLLSIPISGWVMVSTAKINVPTIYFGLFHVPHINFFAANADGFDDVTRLMHTILAFTLGLLAIGHISAALVHFLIIKDGTVERMLPAKLKIGKDEEQ